MEKIPKKALSRKNLLKLLQFRENQGDSSHFLKKHCQFTEGLVKRIGLDYELQGHQGCVNCLQWTSDGRYLASGSDDTNVIIWDPFYRKQMHVVSTNHIGNIFSVKFLDTNNTIIATAAGDCRVIVQSVRGTSILDCRCHTNRVKRLATSPEEPSLFWSAGEDGMVLQFDLREQHECLTSQAKVLINLNKVNHEAKCIAINPTKPHYIAVGANDCYVRLYDRRMLKAYSFTEVSEDSEQNDLKPPTLDKNCVQYYSPGHLAFNNARVHNVRFATTYITFNSAGTEMLVNMGGEQIYLFDINNASPINEIRKPVFTEKETNSNKYKCRCWPEGNGYVKNSSYTNKPVNTGKKCACFYMRRAYECYRRKWMGDIYSAARDYLHVIRNWPDQIKAYVGLIKCLVALKWVDDAELWYDYLCNINPEFNGTNQARLLRETIQTVKNTPKDGFGEREMCDMKSHKIEEDEAERRLNSKDYDLRFLGHCNTTTDIKEANFLGDDGNFICAGSDEGIIFIWERKHSSLVTALFGDVSIVNCVQPHPNACFIASSGIDSVVKLWSPTSEDGRQNIRIVKEVNSVIEANQHRMAMDPFESMLVNMGYQIQVLRPDS
ncbi:WD and tetratricopeptide repeats protein 1 isoform X2 [Sitophilus oryzae]|uniref:WD and tetratricopeptide repeats protein 1 isoform X2 n=1 Tax=Sitophilus oryzae TaxID=7048 RepID=A0A6J2YFP6_SITOR|nr:WD and tetratricopeptide repeats protein 1 isoform X2 [Sitophilus oryzae]